MDELKKKYWDVIRKTRSSGRISTSVIEKTEKLWEKYDDDVIKQALEIHIRSYPSYKENYTLGIMRNLQNCHRNGGAVGKVNQFNNFQQRDYDFDELERRLLAR